MEISAETIKIYLQYMYIIFILINSNNFIFNQLFYHNFLLTHSIHKTCVQILANRLEAVHLRVPWTAARHRQQQFW